MGEISKDTNQIHIANQGQSWVSSFNFDLLTPQERLKYGHFHIITNVHDYSQSFITNFLFLIMGAIFKHTLIILVSVLIILCFFYWNGDFFSKQRISRRGG